MATVSIWILLVVIEGTTCLPQQHFKISNRGPGHGINTGVQEGGNGDVRNVTHAWSKLLNDIHNRYRLLNLGDILKSNDNIALYFRENQTDIGQFQNLQRDIQISNKKSTSNISETTTARIDIHNNESNIHFDEVGKFIRNINLMLPPRDKSEQLVAENHVIVTSKTSTNKPTGDNLLKMQVIKEHPNSSTLPSVITRSSFTVSTEINPFHIQDLVIRPHELVRSLVLPRMTTYTISNDIHKNDVQTETQINHLTTIQSNLPIISNNILSTSISRLSQITKRKVITDVPAVSHPTISTKDTHNVETETPDLINNTSKILQQAKAQTASPSDVTLLSQNNKIMANIQNRLLSVILKSKIATKTVFNVQKTSTSSKIIVNTPALLLDRNTLVEPMFTIHSNLEKLIHNEQISSNANTTTKIVEPMFTKHTEQTKQLNNFIVEPMFTSNNLQASLVHDIRSAPSTSITNPVLTESVTQALLAHPFQQAKSTNNHVLNPKTTIVSNQKPIHEIITSNILTKPLVTINPNRQTQTSNTLVEPMFTSLIHRATANTLIKPSFTSPISQITSKTLVEPMFTLAISQAITNTFIESLFTSSISQIPSNRLVEPIFTSSINHITSKTLLEPMFTSLVSQVTSNRLAEPMFTSAIDHLTSNSLVEPMFTLSSHQTTTLNTPVQITIPSTSIQPTLLSSLTNQIRTSNTLTESMTSLSVQQKSTVLNMSEHTQNTEIKLPNSVINPILTQTLKHTRQSTHQTTITESLNHLSLQNHHVHIIPSINLETIAIPEFTVTQVQTLQPKLISTKIHTSEQIEFNVNSFIKSNLILPSKTSLVKDTLHQSISTYSSINQKLDLIQPTLTLNDLLDTLPTINNIPKGLINNFSLKTIASDTVPVHNDLVEITLRVRLPQIASTDNVLAATTSTISPTNNSVPSQIIDQLHESVSIVDKSFEFPSSSINNAPMVDNNHISTSIPMAIDTVQSKNFPSSTILSIKNSEGKAIDNISGHTNDHSKTKKPNHSSLNNIKNLENPLSFITKTETVHVTLTKFSLPSQASTLKQELILISGKSSTSVQTLFTTKIETVFKTSVIEIPLLTSSSVATIKINDNIQDLLVPSTTQKILTSSTIDNTTHAPTVTSIITHTSFITVNSQASSVVEPQTVPVNNHVPDVVDPLTSIVSSHVPSVIKPVTVPVNSHIISVVEQPTITIISQVIHPPPVAINSQVANPLTVIVNSEPSSTTAPLPDIVGPMVSTEGIINTAPTTLASVPSTTSMINSQLKTTESFIETENVSTDSNKASNTLNVLKNAQSLTVHDINKGFDQILQNLKNDSYPLTLAVKQIDAFLSTIEKNDYTLESNKSKPVSIFPIKDNISTIDLLNSNNNANKNDTKINHRPLQNENDLNTNLLQLMTTPKLNHPSEKQRNRHRLELQQQVERTTTVKSNTNFKVNEIKPKNQLFSQQRHQTIRVIPQKSQRQNNIRQMFRIKTNRPDTSQIMPGRIETEMIRNMESLINQHATTIPHSKVLSNTPNHHITPKPVLSNVQIPHRIQHSPDHIQPGILAVQQQHTGLNHASIPRKFAHFISAADTPEVIAAKIEHFRAHGR